MPINKVIILGHVGKDPEIKTFDNGNQVATFSVATTEKGYTAQNGTVIPDRTEWHNVVCWKGLAKVIEQFVKKGDKIYIEGKIRSRSYDDSNGVKRYVTEIYADNLELLGSKHESQQSASIESKEPVNTIQNYNDVPPNESDDLPF